MSPPPERPSPANGNLSERTVKESLKAFDWPALKEHLDALQLSDDVLAELLGHVTRSTSLVIVYPDPVRELNRMTFFARLREYVDDTVGDAASEQLLETLRLILNIEAGYRSIVETLDGCEISLLPADTRVAASISRTAAQYADLMKRVDAVLHTSDDISLSQSPHIPLDDGGLIPADAIVHGLISALALTIGMEARKAGWIDGRRRIVLPALPSVGDDERFKAGSTEVLAMCWMHWRRTEERRRYLGGTLETAVKPELPIWAPTNTRQISTYRLERAEIFDHIANERLDDLFGQTLADLAITTDAERQATGIENAAGLFPNSWVSLSEAHAAIGLSELLNYDVGTDQERPGGLRLVEWLRGYATLSVLAQQRTSPSDSSGLVFEASTLALQEVLERCGLSAPAAATFLDAVTLTTSSRDLFDTPLIANASGTTTVFAPALLNVNHARIVLSAVASRGEPLSRKGKSFEASVLTFFKAQGLDARGFTARRDGEEYEYDSVVVWGDYVFVFECKNYSLSGHHPIQAYYFQLEMDAAGRQVLRQADALVRHPSILLEHMGVELGTKRVVPCVLNAMPYALPGEVAGVRFVDFSGLRRFFQERYFHLKTPFQVDEGVMLVLRTAMHDMWAGPAPSVEAFLRHLDDPFQLQLILAHTVTGWKQFAVAQGHLVIAEELQRTALTVESYANAVGVSPERIHETRREVATRVATIPARQGGRTPS